MKRHAVRNTLPPLYNIALHKRSKLLANRATARLEPEKKNCETTAGKTANNWDEAASSQVEARLKLSASEVNIFIFSLNDHWMLQISTTAYLPDTRRIRSCTVGAGGRSERRWQSSVLPASNRSQLTGFKLLAHSSAWRRCVPKWCSEVSLAFAAVFVLHL